MSVVVRIPSARISSPLGAVSSDFVKFNAAINAHSSVQFAAFTGTEATSGANDFFSGEAARVMGECQQIGFSRRTKADTTVTLDAGSGGDSLTFSGFMTSPSYLMNAQSIKPALTAVAEAALVSNLKLDIYTTATARNSGGRSSMANGLLTPETLAVSTNLATRLSELTDKMIEYWTANGNGSTGITKKLKQQRHTVNIEGPLQIWQKILAASTESLASTEKWMTIVKGSGRRSSSNRAMNEALLTVLRGVSPDFQTVISQLCSMFQLVMVPSKDGKAAKLITIEEMVTGDAETLVLPASSVLLNGDTSQDLLPVQQVLMTGVPFPATLTAMNAAKRKTDDGGFFVGGYPEEAPSASGEVAIVPTPEYLEKFVIAGDPSRAGISPVSPTNFKSDISRLKDLSFTYANKLVKTAVHDYCKAVYYDMAIGSTSTSISMPANLALWPGKRYQVRNQSGDELFTGFLSGLTHDFSVASGGNGQITTTVNFTHIMFPGFKL